MIKEITFWMVIALLISNTVICWLAEIQYSNLVSVFNLILLVLITLGSTIKEKEGK